MATVTVNTLSPTVVKELRFSIPKNQAATDWELTFLPPDQTHLDLTNHFNYRYSVNHTNTVEMACVQLVFTENKAFDDPRVATTEHVFEVPDDVKATVEVDKQRPTTKPASRQAAIWLSRPAEVYFPGDVLGTP